MGVKLSMEDSEKKQFLQINGKRVNVPNPSGNDTHVEIQARNS